MANSINRGLSRLIKLILHHIFPRKMSETSSNVPLLAGDSTRSSLAAATEPIAIPSAVQSSKRVKTARTVSESVKVTEEADQIAPVRSGDDTSYEDIPIVSIPDNVFIPLDDDEGAGDTIWLDEKVLESLATSLYLQSERQLHPNNFVIGRFLSAYPQDKWPSVKLLERRLKGTTEPRRFNFDPTGYLYKVWLVSEQARSKRAIHLVPTGGIQHASYEDRSFGWMSSIVHIWPPPLVIGTEDEYSHLFSFAILDAQHERTILNILRFKLKVQYSGAFFVSNRDPVCVFNHSMITFGSRGGHPVFRSTNRRYHTPRAMAPSALTYTPLERAYVG